MDNAFIVGIDPSLAGSAVAIIRADGSHSVKRFASKSRGTSVRERNGRYLSVVSRIIEFIGDDDPLVICIEGYSYGSHQGQAALAELGGILRSDLCVYESAKIFEVAPTTLKKFVTGKGNTDKIAVVAKSLERWDVGFSTSDEFDAFGLAKIAACIAKLEQPENTPARQCLKTITGQSFAMESQPLLNGVK